MCSNRPFIKMKYITIIYICTFAAIATATPVSFKDCGSVSGKPEVVDLNPCPSLPCQFKQNTNVSINVKFTSDVDTNSAKNVLHGIIAGVPLPFPIPSNACAGNVQCPIKKGSELTYTNQMSILPSYPKVSLVAKIELQDQDGKDLFCFVIPAEITD